MDEPVELPIDGVLDLHTFNPREIKDLVPDYLAACRERGILQVRIIHGFGTGQLRRSIGEYLDRHPLVATHQPAPQERGGGGVTVAELKD